MSFPHKLLIITLAIGVVGCVPGRADFLPIAQPNQPYISSTHVISFEDPDYRDITSVSDGSEMLTYNLPLNERSVPESWTTWNSPPVVSSAFPRVASTEGTPYLLIGLSTPAYVLGLEIEPDLPVTEEIVADFYTSDSLAGTIDLRPNGNAGALLYAASTNTEPFSYVFLDNVSGDDFAVAQQRYGLSPIDSVPEPATAGTLLCALFVWTFGVRFLDPVRRACRLLVFPFLERNGHE